MTHLVLLNDMAKSGYFIEAGQIGRVPIEALMLSYGGELLTSALMGSLDTQLRQAYLNQLATTMNSQIVYVADKSTVYSPQLVQGNI